MDFSEYFRNSWFTENTTHRSFLEFIDNCPKARKYSVLPGPMSLDFCCNVLDFSIQIWHEQHPASYQQFKCCWWCCNDVGDITFSWHTLGLFNTNSAIFKKSTACLSIVADHVHSFMIILYPSSIF